MGEIKILIFKLNNEYFATDIMDVERILEIREATKVPDAPNFLEGVIKYEEQVVPVLNLYKKFNLEKIKGIESEKIIIAKNAIGKFGIIVDDVDEVINIKKDLIDTAENVSTLISDRYIKGVIREENRLIILLDFNNILLEKEQNIVS